MHYIYYYVQHTLSNLVAASAINHPRKSNKILSLRNCRRLTRLNAPFTRLYYPVLPHRSAYVINRVQGGAIGFAGKISEGRVETPSALQCELPLIADERGFGEGLRLGF